MHRRMSVTPRTAPPTRRRNGLRLGALVLVLVVVSYFQIASASQISLSGARIGYAASLGPCSTNPVTVTNTTTGATATQVTISGLNNSTCSGETVQLWLRDATSTVAVTSGTVTASSLALTVPSYTPANVAGAIVYVGGWPVTTTWTYAPPVQLPLVSCEPVGGGSETCTVAEFDDGSSKSWTNGEVTYWQKWFLVTTTSTSTDGVPWQVTINLSHSSLPAYAASLTDNSGLGLVLVSTSDCSASPRTVTVKGNTEWGWNTVTNTNSRAFQVTGATTGTGGLLSC